VGEERVESKNNVAGVTMYFGECDRESVGRCGTVLTQKVQKA